MEECNEDNNEAGWFSFCLGGGSKRVMVRGSIEDGKKITYGGEDGVYICY
jgi:hypothetical protein